MSDREALAFRLCCLAIALYIVDDAFVHPEPGTSAGDHLAGGLVPTAILAVLAALLPRARAGAAAAVALALGLSTVAVGIAVPVRHIGLQGPSGDDWTGLLALAAGVVLVGLGTRVLWRSRRLDTPHWRRYLRRAAIGVAAAVVAFELVFPIPFAFIATHKARSDVEAVDLGRAAEPVSVRTGDGLRLRGSYVPSRNGAAILVFPGRGGNTASRARMLARQRLRGPRARPPRRGRERRRLQRSRLRRRAGRARRGAVSPRASRRPRAAASADSGLSVGGELLIEAAAQSPALRAVVSEGAGLRSYREQVDTPGRGHWTTFPFWVVTSAATAVFGNAAIPPGLTSLTPRISPRSLFLIWATNGNAEEVNAPYLDAAGEPKQGWEIPESGTRRRARRAPRRVRAPRGRVLRPRPRRLRGSPHMPAHRILVTNGHVLSMDPEIGELADGSVLIEDDRIVAVGPELDGADAEIIDADGGVILPGFVDTHRHTWQTALRGICADWTLFDYTIGMRMTISPRLSAEDVYVGNHAGALEALDAGVTTILDFSHCNVTPDHADRALQGLLDAGIRAVFAYGYFAPPAADPHFTITRCAWRTRGASPATSTPFPESSSRWGSR